MPCSLTTIYMRIHQILRGLSILAYMCICWQGEIISGPMWLLLYGALVNSDFISQVVALFALIGMLTSVALIAFPNKNWALFLEPIIFVLLLLPILREFSLDSVVPLNYPLFIIPVACFTILYLLSLIYSYKLNTKGADVL